jgi:hypothetical protein
VVFNVSSDEYRWRMSEGMRYLVAGLDTLSATTSSLGGAVTELADEVGRTNFLLEVVASNQREIIEILITPLATKAAEVLRRAAWAAEKGFWAEAVQDYDKAIGLDWHQPTAHFGRGLALLAQAGPNHVMVRQWEDAIGSFEKAARYGESLDPPLAVSAVQCTVACNDRLGRTRASDTLLTWATQHLAGSPEIAFSAALRFRAPILLKRALTLDPTLAADPAWQDLPVAEDIVHAVRQDQTEAIKTSATVLAKAKRYGTVPQASAAPVSGCPQGFEALSELAPKLAAARSAVSQPTDEEQELSNRVGGRNARTIRLQNKIITADQKKMTWRQLLGFGTVIVFLVPMIAGAIFAGMAGPERADAALTPAFVIALIVVPLLVILWRTSAKGFHNLQHKAITRYISQFEHQRTELASRRTTVLAEITQAADRIVQLTTRSADAYPPPRSGPSQVPGAAT